MSNDKGDHYTYRVTVGRLYAFVSVLTGPDNSCSYTPIGRFRPDDWDLFDFYSGEPAKVLRWALRKIWLQSSLPQGYDIRHAGRCGRCGRLLTTPESIESGFGPTCIAKV